MITKYLKVNLYTPFYCFGSFIMKDSDITWGNCVKLHEFEFMHCFLLSRFSRVRLCATP